VRGLPGVQQVALSDYPPLVSVMFPYDLKAGSAASERTVKAQVRHVDSNYLRVTGIGLLAGRDFEPADETRRPVPVVINQQAARALFGERGALGQRLITRYRDRSELEVVGVVGDSRQFELAIAPGPQAYLPSVYGSSHVLISRVAGGSTGIQAAVQGIVRRMDPAVPAPTVETLDRRFERSVAKPRFYVVLLGIMASLALILAAIGIYGVMSYNVARRTREFGIRMALGAQRGDILALVLGLGMRLTFAGAVLGAAGGLALTRVLTSLLYGVSPGDPLTFASSAIFLGGIATAASYLAARRAVAVDPSVALRYD
jgi:putative ABC transport system permease protein